MKEKMETPKNSTSLSWQDRELERRVALARQSQNAAVSSSGQPEPLTSVGNNDDLAAVEKKIQQPISISFGLKKGKTNKFKR
jgi:hypothetical protein